MPAGKLATSVRVTDEGGRHIVIAAGDDVPAWASKQIVNPKAWDGDAPEAKKTDADGEPAAEGYESKTVAALVAGLDLGAQGRDDESRVSGDGNKADLIAALEADDGRA